jgi:hypothetical protein
MSNSLRATRIWSIGLSENTPAGNTMEIIELCPSIRMKGRSSLPALSKSYVYDGTVSTIAVD